MEWISIKDSLPEMKPIETEETNIEYSFVSEPVLVYLKHETIMIVHAWRYKPITHKKELIAWTFADYKALSWAGNITHWMPLPEPPKDNK